MNTDPTTTTDTPAYQPPTVVVLGTLTELTQGGTVSSATDGFGSAGDSGDTSSI